MDDDFNFEPPSDNDLFDRLGDGGSSDRDKFDALRELGERRLRERKWALARDMFEQALVIAVKNSWLSDKYQMIGHIARTTARLGDIEAALALFAEHEGPAQAELEANELQFLYRAKGFVYSDDRRAVSALECFQTSLRLARESDDWYGIAMDTRKAAKIHILLREYTTAAEMLDNVIPDAQDNCYILGVLMLMHTRAKLFIEVGENARAVELMREALDCDEYYPQHEENIAMHITLATALVRLGNLAEAAEELDYIEKNSDRSRTKNAALVKLLRADMVGGAAAFELRRRARARAHTDGQYRLANVADVNMAMQLVQEGNLPTAERHLRRALASAVEHDDTNIEQETRIRLAALLVEDGRFEEALDQLGALADVHFGDDFALACRHRAVLGSAYVAAGQYALAVETVQMLFAIAPVLENFAFLADAHYVVATATHATEGRSVKWATHLGKSIAYLNLAGDDLNASDRAIEFLDEDVVHPERLLDLQGSLDEHNRSGSEPLLDGDEPPTGQSSDENPELPRE
ncbi:MAG: hypothetical protein RLZZ319_291 [Actinomycetota bacterium]|jgi:tetratricopeptide (TPR) repeat protein